MVKINEIADGDFYSPNFRLSPKTLKDLPAVKKMEVGHYYLNENNVYQHPISIIKSDDRSDYYVEERFYRPSHGGHAWHSIYCLAAKSLLCGQYNWTSEIRYSDWKRAFDDRNIWR